MDDEQEVGAADLVKLGLVALVAAPVAAAEKFYENVRMKRSAKLQIKYAAFLASLTAWIALASYLFIHASYSIFGWAAVVILFVTSVILWAEAASRAEMERNRPRR